MPRQKTMTLTSFKLLTPDCQLRTLDSLFNRGDNKRATMLLKNTPYILVHNADNNELRSSDLDSYNSHVRYWMRAVREGRI